MATVVDLSIHVNTKLPEQLSKKTQDRRIGGKNDTMVVWTSTVRISKLCLYDKELVQI